MDSYEPGMETCSNCGKPVVSGLLAPSLNGKLICYTCLKNEQANADKDTTDTSRTELRKSIFMSVAQQISRLSTCPRRHVGCVITDEDSRIIATGYNGVPAGHEHCVCACNRVSASDLGRCKAVHAEANALLFCDTRLARSLYVTSAPCIDCAKLIANTSIKYVAYQSSYDNEVLSYFKVHGIATERIP